MKYIHSEEVLDVPENGESYPKTAALATGKDTPREKGESVWLCIRGTKMTRTEESYQVLTLITCPLVKVQIKSRIVIVEGPRGKRTRL